MLSTGHIQEATKLFQI